MFNYLKSISDENLKLIPQQVVKRAFIDKNDRRNAIWDMHITKSGRCFVAICAELHVSECVSLYEYKFSTNELILCFNLSDKVCQFKDAITTSKIHTSMCDLPDGRIIMTTHTTAQSPVHPYWYPEPFYNHPFEGYPGSIILIYDPETGAVENRGIPVPRESIYGACYDPKRNSLYFTGYLRGHLYRYDLDTSYVRDYGQVTEFGSFRLHKAGDGNIYSASRSGNFYRINTDTQEIEELGIFFPKDYEPFSTGKHTQLDYIADGPDGYLYLKYIFGKNMYRYNFKNNYLECMGEYIPDTLDVVDPYSAFGLVFDENGVMWYSILMHDEYYSVVNAYLCRWDILNGGKPQNMGLLGTPERSLTVCSEMEYHNGILYVADSNHNFDVPGVFTVDLRKLDALEYSLLDGDIPYTKDIMNYMILENPRKFYKYSLEEYDRQEEHNSHYFKYIEEYNGFLNENPINMVSNEVEVYSIWKEYTYVKSQVKNVRFEDESVIAEFGNDTEKFSLCTKPYSVKSIDAYSVCEKVTKEINMPKLSAAAGRGFKAVPTAAVKIFDNKYLIGTADGMLNIFDGENVFGLGACPNCSGAVVDMCYCDKTQTAYGIIGSQNDIGIVFSFSKTNGIRYLGRMFFNTEKGLSASFELSCIAVNREGTKIAVGSKDRLGMLYVLSI